MPHYQIPKARLLRAEMHMSLSQFSIFTSLIRSAAKRYLNCGLRPEDQDPNDLQQFMRMVQQRQPNFSKKYEDSWPVMAYLEIYLLRRIQKAAYLKRRFGRYRKGFNRCLDPIWFRYAHANKTGTPFKRNCQATVRAYCGPKKPTESPRLCERSASNAENEMIKMVYPLRNCVSVVVKRLRKEISTPDSASGADSETDINPLSSKASSPSPPRAIAPLCTDPVLNFLSSAKPNLADFHSHFVNMGFIDDNALKAFFSWPVDVQESMMRAELGRSMNSLQLHVQSTQVALGWDWQANIVTWYLGMGTRETLGSTPMTARWATQGQVISTSETEGDVDQSEPVEQGQTKEALTGVSSVRVLAMEATYRRNRATSNIALNFTASMPFSERHARDYTGHPLWYSDRLQGQRENLSTSLRLKEQGVDSYCTDRYRVPRTRKSVPGENGTSSDLQPDGEETSRQNSLDCLDIFLSVVDGRKVSMSYLSSTDVIVVAAASPGKSKTHENGRFNIA
ncbi:hypothetical protein EDD17DRAFT_1515934 [Pisolithus thermaeus]|nr:hypothetical protein EDD17DRAFT_1515934 [Pisolithus thermaeus]